MITLESSGDFAKTKAFFDKAQKLTIQNALRSFGQQGVEALKSATPSETGKTAAAWDFDVTHDRWGWQINWYNRNVIKGVNIAIILQYGHGTGTGGFVSGQDYINPALKPIFDKIATDVWKAVTSV